MRFRFVLVTLGVVGLSILGGCPRGPDAGGDGLETAGAPRPGPAPDMVAFVPGDAIVALRADLSVVRSDPARYDWFVNELASELDLASDGATVRALLDRTEQAIGVVLPGAAGRQEGFLVVSGRFAESDFERMVAIASARHAGRSQEERGEDGRRIVRLGDAVLVQLDTWTWAIGEGAAVLRHLSRASGNGRRAFDRELIEFGARIGLPAGSAQAWAHQDTEVGTDMVGLVFQGENPQMVQNFVSTVGRHLGL